MYNDVYQCQPISIVSILLYLALRPPHDPQTSCAQLLMTWIFPWFPSCFRPCEGDSHNPCFLLVKFNHEICIDMHRYAVELADSLASSKTGQIQNHQPPADFSPRSLVLKHRIHRESVSQRHLRQIDGAILSWPQCSYPLGICF